MTERVPIRKPTSILDQVRETQDRIMRRAYEIFERNGGVAGSELENWTQAERELVWKPAFELSEKDGQFQLEAAIAGVEAKDIEIKVTPEHIVLTADTQHRHNEQKGMIHYCEFETGKMFRSIHLPRKIDTDKVKAEFKNGLLRLTAEIAEEARGKKRKRQAA
ncbi:MAG TPA: Hsp20 family protein [Terriglobia bacterium]|nr:Hsp20 family protein [Terriglobia bacterium]